MNLTTVIDRSRLGLNELPFVETGVDWSEYEQEINAL